MIWDLGLGAETEDQWTWTPGCWNGTQGLGRDQRLVDWGPMLWDRVSEPFDWGSRSGSRDPNMVNPDMVDWGSGLFDWGSGSGP